MWSHYADKHRGMCLGFDVHDEVLRTVRYVHKPEIVGRMIDVKLEKAFGERLVDSLLEVKYAGWEYEEEVRMHAMRNEKDAVTGQYFADFSDKIVLREVIAGPRFTDVRAVIEQGLKSNYEKGDVKILKARVSSIKFMVVEDTGGF